MIRTPVTTKIKLALVLIAIGIVISVLMYTHGIVGKLQERERRIVRLYAKGLEYFNKSDLIVGDLTFILDEISGTVDFPIILTSRDNEIVSHKNVEIDVLPSKKDTLVFLQRRIEEMKQVNPPIVITFNDTIITNYFYYDESKLVKQLRWLPYVEFLVAGMFILIGYIGFSYIRRSEQSNIWVGMAKETAHQLGTPLSSIMGWIEILRSQREDPIKLAETLNEMETDVDRLNKVVQRFSKIGSKPELKEVPIGEIVTKVLAYFQKRIPQTGKTVELQCVQSAPVLAKVNGDLFEWVLENLIKNALDAIENGNGKIQIVLTSSGKHALVDVIDNGKGIEKKFKNDVFRPGYSTKKRGWGLGLSLSKRIIENYHKGKLFIVDSAVGKGTTFRVKLRA